MFSNLFQARGVSAQPEISGPKWIEAAHRKESGGLGLFRFGNNVLGKTLKFRAVTLVTTLGITWLLTGNPVTSVGLTVLQQSTNTAVYYFFEKNEHKKFNPN